MNRVVVTGLGMVNSLGASASEGWRRLLAGENGVSAITLFDASEYSVKVAAEIPTINDWTWDEMDNFRMETGLRSIPGEFCRRAVAMFYRSAIEAFEDAGLRNSPDLERAGVAAGHSVPFIDHGLARQYFRMRRPGSRELDLNRFAREGKQPAHSFWRRQANLIAAAPAKKFGLGGPSLVVDTACAASGHAIASAFRLLQRGKASAMIAGGASALVSPLSILYFAVLGALSRHADPERAARPFDRDRDGFVMGEGGGAVVLETLDHARARGARIYAELAGYGSTLNAYTITDPSPDGSCEAAAMRQAMDQAGLRPEEIVYVAAHGTSTPKNDTIETAALKLAFGEHARRLMVSSNKGQIGHTIAGACVTNLICAVKAIVDNVIPPTMHYRKPDPDCDLDYVPNEARRAKVPAALVNAFAFGGQNLTLAVKALGES